MSVGNFGTLFSSVCVLAPTYTSLCRGLEYLLKVRYIILVYPNGAGFLIFNSVFCCMIGTLPYVWKYITKMSGICVW